MKLSEKKITINYKILAFLLVLIPKIVLCFFTKLVVVNSDEVATLAGGTLLTGLDWSAVISHAGYYGSGMTVFTAPLYWITDNPFVIYRGVQIFCAVLQSVSAIIAYSLCEKVFKIENQKVCMLISVASGFLVTNRSIAIYNEHGLILVSWIIAWLLTQLHCAAQKKERKKRVIYTCLLMLVMGYSLTLHTRSVMFYIALVILCVFYAWTYRKSIVHLPAAVVCGGIFAIAGKLFVSCSKDIIWAVSVGKVLRNTQISLKDNIAYLFDSDHWQAWANIIMGQLHTVGVFSGGLFIILIILFVHWMWNAVLRKKQPELVEKVFPIVVFFSACVAMSIVGQSFTWLKGSILVIDSGFYNTAYASKAYGYLRYFGPYLGPLGMVGLVCMYKEKEEIKRCMKKAFALLCVIEGYWLICIVPYLAHTDQVGALEFYMPFALATPRDAIRLRMILPASFFMLLIFLTFWLCITYGRQWIANVILIALWGFLYLFIGMTWERAGSVDNYAAVSETYEFLEEYKDAVDIPEVIYVEDTRDVTDHQIFYIYQFLFNRHTIEPGVPEEPEDEVFVLSNDASGNYSEWTEQGYKYIWLDDEQIIFIKGEQLQRGFAEQGVELH